MFKRLFTVALVFGAAATSPPAAAQTTTCAPRADIVARLTGQYHEEIAAQGLQNAAVMIEVFASRKSRTFTVLASRLDGQSCVMATGEGWSGIFPHVDPNDPLG